MLNAEKYKKEILDIAQEGHYFAFSKYQNVTRCCISVKCEDCIFNGKDFQGCDFSRMKWLLSEYKEPKKLTRFEFDVLKYLSDNTTRRYIIRDNYRNIYLFDKKPKKSGGCWYGNGAHSMAVFNKLFQFVQWGDEEATSIQDVLENCEVKEDGKKR